MQIQRKRKTKDKTAERNFEWHSIESPWFGPYTVILDRSGFQERSEIEIALGPETALPEGAYINDSIEVDTDVPIEIR